MILGTWTCSSCVIGTGTWESPSLGLSFRVHDSKLRLDHLLDVLVHHAGLGDDLGYVDLLLLRHRNRHLDTPLALAPASMPGSRTADFANGILVTFLSAWFLEVPVPYPQRPQRSAPPAGDGCGSV